MEWFNQHNTLPEKLQAGWIQTVQAIQSGNFDMLSIEAIIVVSMMVVMNLIVFIVLVRMNLIVPILKFILFVLILGVVRLLIWAARESMRV